VRDGACAASRRMSSRISSADFSRAPAMSRPFAGMVRKPSSARSMSLMM
jgi:hypothetical protein